MKAIKGNTTKNNKDMNKLDQAIQKIEQLDTGALDQINGGFSEVALTPEASLTGFNLFCGRKCNPGCTVQQPEKQ